MKYVLKRKLRGCPLPVGTVSDYNSSGMVRFSYKYPAERGIRVWRLPRWLCYSMPYYFRWQRRGTCSLKKGNDE